jgi:hypothetical protein
MGEIYSRCQRFLIWLGPEVQDFESMSHYFGSGSLARPQQQAAASFSTSDDSAPTSQKELIFDVARQHSFVRSMLSLPWFSRAWVVQEAILPTEATCFLSSFTFSIDEFWTVIRRFRSSEDRILPDNYIGLRQLQGYLVLSEIMRLRDQKRARGESGDEEKPSFYHSLSLFAPRCRTSTKHDIIYAFLGLQTDTHMRILPDYHLDWNEVPLMVTRSIIEASESLDLLGVLHRRDDDQSRWSNLPSWVPDWSRRLKAEAMVFPKHSMYFDSSSGMRHKLRRADSLPSSHLVIKGKLVSEISHTVAFAQIDREPATSRHQWPVHSYLNISSLGNLPGILWPQECTPLSRERILRTCLADGSFEFSRTTPSQCREGLSASDVEVLLKTIDYLHLVAADQNLGPSKPSKSWAKRATRLRDHARIAWGRQLVVGRDWRLGLAHDAVKEGDLICIAHGSKVPLVLRPLHAGYYRLMGQCYYEGAMRGEESSQDEADANEFILV